MTVRLIHSGVFVEGTLIRSSLRFDPDQLFPLLGDALGRRVHLRTLKSRIARLKIYSQRRGSHFCVDAMEIYLPQSIKPDACT